ncbi:MAG: 3-phosphoglycerate dehydrogenase [Lachnospiraceae bacterium]|nr:3-phosphoglycerate dehydrogenase [Lachnospiraceae bacterium]
MTKYTCLNPIAKVGLDVLTDQYEAVESLADANVALVRSAAMHDLDLPDSLVAVARAGAGVNNIPLPKCAEQGVVVFNTPGANANGVKELVIAGLLLASRNIVGGCGWVKENVDDENISKSVEKSKKAFAGTEIMGKKLGVIGMGAIGVLVANAANALGMEVIGYDPFLSTKSAWNVNSDVTFTSEVEDLYKTCDYLTIHVPLLDSTRAMINKDAISKMKDGVKFLNFSRDTLVNDADMLEALESGKVGCYVTDFPNPAVVKGKNVVVIPHLGASTAESEDNCAIMAAKEIRDYVENGNIVNSVNYPACTLGPKSGNRVGVLYKAADSMQSAIEGVLGGSIVKIADAKRGDFGYCLAEISGDVDVKALEALAGVIKVRAI